MNDHAEDFTSPHGHQNAVISFSEHDDNDDDDDAEEEPSPSSASNEPISNFAQLLEANLSAGISGDDEEGLFYLIIIRLLLNITLLYNKFTLCTIVYLRSLNAYAIHYHA